MEESELGEGDEELYHFAFVNPFVAISVHLLPNLVIVLLRHSLPDSTEGAIHEIFGFLVRHPAVAARAVLTPHTRHTLFHQFPHHLSFVRVPKRMNYGLDQEGFDLRWVHSWFYCFLGLLVCCFLLSGERLYSFQENLNAVIDLVRGGVPLHVTGGRNYVVFPVRADPIHVHLFHLGAEG